MSDECANCLHGRKLHDEDNWDACMYCNCPEFKESPAAPVEGEEQE